jgi:hypothetical protein
MKAAVRTLVVVVISLLLGAAIYAAGSVANLVVGDEARTENLADRAESAAEGEVEVSETSESRIEGLDSIALDLGLIALVTAGILGAEMLIRRRASRG